MTASEEREEIGAFEEVRKDSKHIAVHHHPTQQNKGSIEFSITELEYISDTIEYIFDLYHNEGIDIRKWRDPRILDRIRTKADKAIKKLLNE